jgi:predicted RNase H-like HicB family nuclease
MAEFRYTVLFEPAEEGGYVGGYVVTCPALPGLVTEGNRYAKARERAVEAIEGFWRACRRMDCRFPPTRSSRWSQ